MPYDEQGNFYGGGDAVVEAKPTAVSIKSTPSGNTPKTDLGVKTKPSTVLPKGMQSGGVIGQFQKDYMAGEQAKADLATQQAQEREKLMTPIIAEREQTMSEFEKRAAEINRQMAEKPQLPKETAMDFAQLGSLVSILGVMLGTMGKNSANLSLSGMTGMLNGYRQGRADLYEKSKKEFEEGFKQLQAQSAQIQTELALYMEKSKTKETGAMEHLNVANAMLAGGVAQQIAKGGMADKVANLQMQLRRIEQSATQHKKTVDLGAKIAQIEYQQAEQNVRSLQAATPGKITPQLQDAINLRNTAKAKFDAYAGVQSGSSTGGETAESIAADFKSGKITREQAESKLRAIGVED